MTTTLTHRVEVTGPPRDGHQEILTPEALDFLGQLHAAFEERRRTVLAERRRRALRLASGVPLGFSVATARIREDHGWRAAPPAPGLADRRVEITGPPTRRAAVDALTSGARVWVADFADATSPTWQNIVEGQLVLRDAVDRGTALAPPGGGQRAGDHDRLATVVVRPRGWHLTEEHLRVDGSPLSGSLVDFGLAFFHGARKQLDAGRGPYFSLSKLENHYDARLWNDVFVTAQDLLGIPRGTVRATAVIETVPAAFEMDEILHELREHSSGLAVGRLDYVSSVVRNFAHRPDFVLPDLSMITATAPFLRACTDLLVRTCHRRGAHAIGGTTAQLPRADAGFDEAVLARLRLDLEREAEDGFDGSDVAHPALVPVCREAFDGVLAERPHQIDRARDDVHVTAQDLLAVRRTAGPPTPEGVRTAVAVALRYVDFWLRGRGTVELDGLMADAATAEVARCQLWQWLRHGAADRGTVLGLLDRECAALAQEDPNALVIEAREVLQRTALTREPPAFLTAVAYQDHLVRPGTERPGPGRAGP